MKKIVYICFIALAVLFTGSCDSDIEKLQQADEIAENIQQEKKVEFKVFTDFIYDVGPRFYAISKHDIANIVSFSDIIGEEHANRILSYDSLDVMIFDGDNRSDLSASSEGKDGIFTPAQLELLRSASYSTNILVWAEYREKNKETGELRDTHWTPNITVVPHKQAKFKEGKEALKDYLRVESEPSRADVDPEKFTSAKLYFTVSVDGTIENTWLDRSSGYPEVDKVMIELIGKTKGMWDVAENVKGEKVAQELVVSFGLMGC